MILILLYISLFIAHAVPVGASAVSRSGCETQKSVVYVIIKVFEIGDQWFFRKPTVRPSVLDSEASSEIDQAFDARTAKRPELPALTPRLPFNIVSFLLFFWGCFFLSTMTVFFYVCVLCFRYVKLALGYAISNFKLRFVPRELWNVVVDALVRSLSLVGKWFFHLHIIA